MYPWSKLSNIHCGREVIKTTDCVHPYTRYQIEHVKPHLTMYSCVRLFVALVKRHPFCKTAISQNFFPKLSLRTQCICFWHFNRCLPFYIFYKSHYLLSFLFSFARLKSSEHMDRVLIIFFVDIWFNSVLHSTDSQ